VQLVRACVRVWWERERVETPLASRHTRTSDCRSSEQYLYSLAVSFDAPPEPSEPRCQRILAPVSPHLRLDPAALGSLRLGAQQGRRRGCLRSGLQKSSTLSPIPAQSAPTRRPTGFVSSLPPSPCIQLTGPLDPPQIQAIKKFDAEPLLRQDIQWQVLDHIFADRSFRFTAPVDSASLPLRLAFRPYRVTDKPGCCTQKSPPAPPIYVNFDQLFLEAILSSLKTTQNVRSKLIANPEFAMNYCKICLLINVGRFNTTLACTLRSRVGGLLARSPASADSSARTRTVYPNMRTALRTYHPVPSLQTEETSRKEMSDAPRLKAMLKAAMLDWEVKHPPTTLKDVAQRAVRPPPPRLCCRSLVAVAVSG
jgi:hypothetical protein